MRDGSGIAAEAAPTVPRPVGAASASSRSPMTDEVARMNRKTICSIVFSCAALAAFGAAAQSQQGGGIKQDAKAVGHGVANGARDVGHATRDVTKKIGHGAKEAGTGIGHGAKKAGVAVGHGAKEGWDAT